MPNYVSALLCLRAVPGARPSGALRATKSAIHADLFRPWMALCREAQGCAGATTCTRCSENDEQGCSNVAKGRTPDEYKDVRGRLRREQAVESDQGHYQAIKKNPDAPKGTSGFLNLTRTCEASLGNT